MAIAASGVAHVKNKEEKACSSPSAMRSRSAVSSVCKDSGGTSGLFKILAVHFGMVITVKYGPMRCPKKGENNK